MDCSAVLKAQSNNNLEEEEEKRDGGVMESVR